MTNVSDALPAEVAIAGLLADLAEEAAHIRQLEDDRKAAYAKRLELYRELKEAGAVHKRIASAAGVSETAVTLALRPKKPAE